jgi:hypothetical protein
MSGSEADIGSYFPNDAVEVNSNLHVAGLAMVMGDFGDIMRISAKDRADCTHSIGGEFTGANGGKVNVDHLGGEPHFYLTSNRVLDLFPGINIGFIISAHRLPIFKKPRFKPKHTRSPNDPTPQEETPTPLQFSPLHNRSPLFINICLVL